MSGVWVRQRLRAGDPVGVVVKITRQVPSRRNQSIERDTPPLVAALVVDEEEGFVFYEGSAERPTVLVEIEFLARGCEKAARIELCVAEKLEE